MPQRDVRGTFHFHSTYSHDGRSTLEEIVEGLRARAVSFCIMTEHFEDFDATKFSRYLDHVDRLNRSQSFLLVPGVEVNLSGIDTILFPVSSYDQVIEYASTGRDPDGRLYKVLAHPTKYHFDRLQSHLAAYRLDAIEMWNQQADGHYIPPLSLLSALRRQEWRHRYRYFFGCDLHDVTLNLANTIALRLETPLTGSAVVDEIRKGAFAGHNASTRLEFRNGMDADAFDRWVDSVLGRRYFSGRVLKGIRRWLRRAYRLLPRDTQHRLNDVKNAVRNRV